MPRGNSGPAGPSAQPGMGFAAPGPAATAPSGQNRGLSPADGAPVDRRTWGSALGRTRSDGARAVRRRSGTTWSTMEMTRLPPAGAGLAEEGDEAPYEFSYIDYLFSSLNESADLVASSDTESHYSSRGMSCIFSCLRCFCGFAPFRRRSSISTDVSDSGVPDV